MYIKRMSEVWASCYSTAQSQYPTLKKYAQDNWQAVAAVVLVAVGAYFQWGKVGLFLAFSTMTVFYQMFGPQVEIAKKFGTKDIAILSASWAVAGTAGWLQVLATCWATGVTAARLWQQYAAQTVIEDQNTRLSKENAKINEEMEKLRKTLNNGNEFLEKFLTNNKEFVSLVGDAAKIQQAQQKRKEILETFTDKVEVIESVLKQLGADGKVPDEILHQGFERQTKNLEEKNKENGLLKEQLNQMNHQLDQFQPAQGMALSELQSQVAILKENLLRIAKGLEQ